MILKSPRVKNFVNFVQIMKNCFVNLIVVLFVTLGTISCNQRKPVEITTPAQQIMTDDSAAVVAAIDSIDSTRVDPETQETALQQDPPPVPVNKNTDCNAGF